MTIIHRNNNGFSLLELMVAMAIFSILLGSIYGAYRSQLGAYVTQQQVVDMQQNLRGALNLMQREIRMAGYDPVDPRDGGFMTNFPSSGPVAIGPTSLAFSFDADSDGTIDPNDPWEVVAYRLNGTTLERYFMDASSGSGTWEALVEHVDALSFVYLDENGTRIDDGGGVVSASVDEIMTVEMTLVARSGENEAVLSMKQADNRKYRNQQGEVILDKSSASDNFRRQILTAQIVCRNLPYSE